MRCRFSSFWILFSLLSILVGCEYVRPTLNAPLKQWERNGSYRFSNLAPGGEDNSDRLTGCFWPPPG